MGPPPNQGVKFGARTLLLWMNATMRIVCVAIRSIYRYYCQRRYQHCGSWVVATFEFAFIT